MSDYDLTKNTSHPIGWTNDPVKRGEEERRIYGTGNQAPRQPGESHADEQLRLHGKY